MAANTKNGSRRPEPEGVEYRKDTWFLKQSRANKNPEIEKEPKEDTEKQ